MLRNDPQRGDGTPAEIRTVAREFWMKEVRWAEEFVLQREQRMQQGSWEENYFGRETLMGVMDTINGIWEMGSR